MKTKQIIDIEKQNYLPVFGRYPVALESGRGVKLRDSEGREYLDFFAGIAVSLLGHNHPALVKAVSAQAGKLIHCTNYFYTAEQSRLVKNLARLSGLQHVFLANSGTEAVEGAIKLARKYGAANGGRYKILSAKNSFHGRTLAALAATGQLKFHKGFEPLPAGFDYVEFNNIADLKKKLDKKTAAVILEPIQGEGGIHVTSKAYLKAAAKLCAENNTLLIFDEIQTGVCRTGKMFCFQHYGVKPDIMTLAKGLGGGVPIGALLCGDKVAKTIGKGDHGSTFGGNPLACAAANAVLDTAAKKNLAKNAKTTGEYLIKKLNALKAKYPVIKEVRGKGLLVGAELNKEGGDIVKKCLEKGLMINCTAGNVLRFTPPLIITKKDIDRMIKILEKTL